MSKKIEPEDEPAQLSDEDLSEVQGGFALTDSPSKSSKAGRWRSRGNNVFGFEDLPSNVS